MATPHAPSKISYGQYVQLAWSHDWESRVGLIELCKSRVARLGAATLAGGGAGALAASPTGVGTIPAAVIGAAIGFGTAASIYFIYDYFNRREWETIRPKLLEIIRLNPRIVYNDNGTYASITICPLTRSLCIYPVSIVTMDGLTDNANIYEFEAIESKRSERHNIPFWYVLQGQGDARTIHRLTEVGSRPFESVSGVVPNPTAYLLMCQLCTHIVNYAAEFTQFSAGEIENIRLFQKYYREAGLQIVRSSLQTMRNNRTGDADAREARRDIIHYYTDVETDLTDCVLNPPPPPPALVRRIFGCELL